MNSELPAFIYLISQSKFTVANTYCHSRKQTRQENIQVLKYLASSAGLPDADKYTCTSSNLSNIGMGSTLACVASNEGATQA